MDFLVYAFAGVGIVASGWFLVLAMGKGWAGISRPSALEQRVTDLESRLPK